GARIAGGTLTRLRTQVAHPTDDLRRAHARGAQALAAGDLSRAYRAAATELPRAPVGALAEPARDRLAAALKALGNAWAAYGRAAPSGNATAARKAVSRARARVNAARGTLAAAGYPGKTG
ncbi:MAG: hypothetical protein QOD69_269, partial [Solirubrobacteraceae bacterium]|nr:hypothetical protein [Solirubrobacteraceae bacterium]